MRLSCFLLSVSFLMAVGVARAGVSDEDLAALLAEAQAAGSSGVIVWQHGEPLLEWLAEPDGAPIETMSVTKSILALGVARMLTTGELESLDTPVSEVFPEWRQGQKREITVRQLLNHTSGLQNHPNAGAEIYPSQDFVQLALAAELSHPPGTRFAYNNKATNLVAGLFLPLTGRDVADYMAAELFEPLGISDFAWQRDPAGNPGGMAGLQLHPRDLARLGQLVLDRGRADGQPLIDESVIDELLAAGSELNELAGLLWWRQPEWVVRVIDDESLQTLADAGVDAEFLSGLETAAGRYDDLASLHLALASALGENWRDQVGENLLVHGLTASRQVTSEDIVAWYGDGYLGQYLVVVPESGIVAVRMVRYFDGIGPDQAFPDFRLRVLELSEQ